jgi:putative RNA 2'-phosphotransferase
MKNYEELSKVVSHALRHQPWLYELELDHEGWVSVEVLLSVLRSEKQEWETLCESDLSEMISQSTKVRHELKNGKIRALYGHSTPHKFLKETAQPPEFLYHGTALSCVSIIFDQGIKPMNRHYVHLSTDIDTAKQVASRKSKNTVILIIKAIEAYRENVHFYQGSENVWLADEIPSRFISKVK